MEMSYIDRRKLSAFSNARRNVERDSVVAIVNVKYRVEGTVFRLGVGFSLVTKSYRWRRRVLAIIHELSSRIGSSTFSTS
jgi:hypothetical protein